MKEAIVDRRLGTQIWVERDDSPERIRSLVSRAASLGFGQLRVFLMWPWIQERGPQSWEMDIWDHVFDACADSGISIKATLTSNSGPWWLGTPSVLHSATLTLDEEWRPYQEAYVRAMVGHFRDHPALGQWILWNEPGYPREENPGPSRPPRAAEVWERLLRDTYPSVDDLNRRWRTGFASFSEVPFQEEIVHPAHRDWYWHSWAPYRDDARLRSQLIEDELEWVAKIVRDIDPETPLCVNPNKILNNHAHSGLQLEQMASAVDTIGASFHAPWVFTTFADIDDHSGLVVQGLRLLHHTPGKHSSEVTEVQTGNTFYAGIHPVGVGPSEIAGTYLAPLLAGAESVTGWCFNTRGDDFESGEWGLLNDDDTLNERAQLVPRVRQCLDILDGHLENWRPSPVTAGVVLSHTAQAHQFALGENTHTPVGSQRDIGVQASALAAIEMERIGVSATLIAPNGKGWDSLGALIAVHQNAMSGSEMRLMLDAAERGATVVIDATTGQFDDDSALYRPWPGLWGDEAGLVSVGLDTASDGTDLFALNEYGHTSGRLVGVRSRIHPSFEWRARSRFTWADTGNPVFLERKWGSGKLLYSTAALAPSLHRGGFCREQASLLLADVMVEHAGKVRPVSSRTTVIALEGDDNRRGWAVFAPPRIRRSGYPFQVFVPEGHYLDVWSGEDIHVRADSVVQFHDEHGIALLIGQSGQS